MYFPCDRYPEGIIGKNVYQINKTIVLYYFFYLKGER